MRDLRRYHRLQLTRSAADEVAIDGASQGSAHGKVILLGEHFAVHGGAAIALPVRGRSITVAVAPGNGVFASALGPPSSSSAGAAIRAMLTELAIDPTTIDITVTGDLPIAAGLGGSAAIAAALVRALHPELDRDALRERVHRLEVLAHGRPSGVDGAVVSWRSPIWFEAGAIRELPIDPAWLDAWWLAITPREGSTREAVAKVGAFREAHPERFVELAAAARTAAFTLRDHLQRPPDPISPSAPAPVAIGALFDEAHARLAALGVVNAALDRLVAAARAAGAHGAKLTGAGLGGAVVAIAPPELDLEPALRAAGATDVIRPALTPAQSAR